MADLTIDLTERRLTPSEDGVLRRLVCFERLGATLAPQMRQIKDELRARDQRIEVREPELACTQIPHYA
ncbi:MAG: hypothetical protein NVSMB55_22060 [Mycobacteriales bacterium]